MKKIYLVFGVMIYFFSIFNCYLLASSICSDTNFEFRASRDQNKTFSNFQHIKTSASRDKTPVSKKINGWEHIFHSGHCSLIIAGYFPLLSPILKNYFTSLSKKIDLCIFNAEVFRPPII